MPHVACAAVPSGDQVNILLRFQRKRNADHAADGPPQQKWEQTKSLSALPDDSPMRDRTRRSNATIRRMASRRPTPPLSVQGSLGSTGPIAIVTQRGWRERQQ